MRAGTANPTGGRTRWPARRHPDSAATPQWSGGERGAHGYRNDGDEPVRVLMISEIDGPNISVYPDTNQIGVFDAGPRAQPRFGALFDVDDAVADTAASAGRRSCRQYRAHARQRASRARELPPPRAFAGYRAGEVSAACATPEQSESIANARLLATSPEVGVHCRDDSPSLA